MASFRAYWRLPLSGALLLALCGIAACQETPAAAQTVVTTAGGSLGRASDWGGIKAIAAGGYHTVGLESDGTVVLAGTNEADASTAAGWRGITAITAGDGHTVGLKSDGTVVAVGQNDQGQCGVSNWRGIVAVAAGGALTAGVKSDGTVVLAGRVGDNDVSGWTGIAALSVGGSHVVGLKQDGTVVTTGDNGYGQRNCSAWSGIAAVAAGGHHTVGLKRDGTVVAVGENTYGRCEVSRWRGITAIAANGAHTVGLKRDGTVVAAGDNSSGQCGISGWRGITAVGAGGWYTIGVKRAAAGPYLEFSAQPGGAVAGQPMAPPVKVSLKDRFGNALTAPHAVTFLMGANPGGGRLTGTCTANAANGVATFDNLRIDRPGSGYSLFATATGFLSAVSTAFDISPPPARLAFTVQPTDVAAGRYSGPAVAVALLDVNGKTVPKATNRVTLSIAAGPRGASLLGDATVSAADGVATWVAWVDRPGTYQLRAEAAGLVGATSAAFTVLSCRTVVAAGGNYHGECNVSGWSGITAIAAGYGHTVGLRGDGTVLAVGDNGNPQGGDTGPCDVSSWSGIVAIAAGYDHTVGLRRDGTVVAVGSNSDERGNETRQCDVSAWSGIVAITAGAYHTVGLRQDGTVVAVGSDLDYWGQYAGQCEVSDWNDIVAIAAGENHTVGLRRDGSVVAVGYYDAGVPDVGSWQGITAIAAGGFHIVGLRSDGTVVSAGFYRNGQRDVSDWQGITAIAAGMSYTVGLKRDGSVASAGWGSSGEYDVTGWRGITAVAAGAMHIVGLKAPPVRLAFTTQPKVTPSHLPLPVQVSLVDRFGSTTAGAVHVVTVSLGANPAGASLSGTRTVRAINGVATFNDLMVSKPGSNYTLVASSPGLTGAVSAPFTVTPSPAKLLFIAQPSDATAGASLPAAVKVAIVDTFGNLVTDATDPIQLVIAAGPAGATLSGVSTALAVRGVATFSTLKIDKAGTYYLRAASLTGLTGATSRAFTISAGAPARLAFTVQPGSTAAGAPISPAVRVAVQDRMGNALPAATNTVALALSTNPTAALLAGTKSVAVRNGAAAFPGLSIARAGSGYVLRATAPGLTTAYSAPFDVTPGAPAKLVFVTHPAGRKAGAVLAPAARIGIQDSRGNLVTTATNAVTVRLGRNPTGAALSGATAAAADAGIATFAELKVDKAGAGYTLDD